MDGCCHTIDIRSMRLKHNSRQSVEGPDIESYIESSFAIRNKPWPTHRCLYVCRIDIAHRHIGGSSGEGLNTGSRAPSDCSRDYGPEKH